MCSASSRPSSPIAARRPAITDLLAGQIDLLWDQVTNAIQQVQSGMLHGIAITSTERLDELKDVPTTAELGMPEINYTMWHGLYVVKGTPKDKIAALNEALRKALADPDVATKFKALGTLPFPATEQSPEAHARCSPPTCRVWQNWSKAQAPSRARRSRRRDALFQHLRHDQARQEQAHVRPDDQRRQHDEHRDQHDGGVLDRIAQPYAGDGTGDHQA